jgi:hypothetical protein
LRPDGQHVGAVEQAVRDAGGTVVATNAAVGLITAMGPATGFAERVSTNRAVFGVAKKNPIGSAPADEAVAKPDVVEKEAQGSAKSAAPSITTAAKPVGTDPLDDQLWGLKSVRSDLPRPFNRATSG